MKYTAELFSQGTEGGVFIHQFLYSNSQQLPHWVLISHTTRLYTTCHTGIREAQGGKQDVHGAAEASCCHGAVCWGNINNSSKKWAEKIRVWALTLAVFQGEIPLKILLHEQK